MKKIMLVKESWLGIKMTNDIYDEKKKVIHQVYNAQKDENIAKYQKEAKLLLKKYKWYENLAFFLCIIISLMVALLLKNQNILVQFLTFSVSL